MKNIFLEDFNLDILIALIKNVGLEVMEIYESNDFQTTYKSDNTPLTKADLITNNLLCKSLKELYPKIPIISEESTLPSFESLETCEFFWCLDPIDGTKEFIKKSGEFTINIGLVYKGLPVLGLVYAPVFKKLYFAKAGEGAFLELDDLLFTLPLKSQVEEQIKNKNTKEFKILASKNNLNIQTQDFINSIKISNKILVQKGSSLKLCEVASGEGDIYPKFSTTMCWDTCASHAILLECKKDIFIYKQEVPNINSKESRYSVSELIENDFKNQNFLACSKDALKFI